jgi:hypothetical protein
VREGLKEMGWFISLDMHEEKHFDKGIIKEKLKRRLRLEIGRGKGEVRVGISKATYERDNKARKARK